MAKQVGVSERRGAGPLVAIGAVYFVLAAVVAVPVAWMQVPALGDTLNHLARIHILTSLGQSPALQRFYQNELRPVPYLGMDVPVSLLTHLLGIYPAGRVFVTVCVLMPVAAAATLHYALYRRVSLVPVLAFLLAYNYAFARGFLGYLFVACLGVMLFAGWVASDGWPRWRRAAVFAPAALAIYLGHAFAFVAYGLLVAGWELGRAARGRFRPAGAVAADLAAAAAQAVPALIVAYLGRAQASFGTGPHEVFGGFAVKIGMLLSPMFFPGHGWVVGVFAVLPVILAGLAVQARLAPGLWPALASLAVVACCVPHVLFNVVFADFRLPLVAAIVLVGAVAPRPGMGLARRWLIVTAAAALVMLRSADAFSLIRRTEAEVEQLRRVVAALPPGQRLLVVSDTPADLGDGAPPDYVIANLPLVATIDRDAFVPYLYTGTTLVEVRPAFDSASSPNVSSITPAQLQDGLAESDPADGPPPYGYGGRKYWLGWPAKFDYVLLFHPGCGVATPPGPLRLLASNDEASLYQITAPQQVVAPSDHTTR